MNRGSLLSCGLLLVAWALPACAAATNQVKFANIIPLLESGYTNPKALANRAAAPQAVPERHRFTQTPEGYLESLGAAPGTEFPVAGAVPGQPELTARNFLKQNGRLFGITSPAVDFKLRKKNSGNGRHSIRLTQTYDGIPVLGGEVVVQANDDGGVEHASGNLDRDTSELDTRQLSTKPRLTADEAKVEAQNHYALQAPGQTLNLSQPELTLFVPGLLKMPGPKRLTWQMEVWSADRIAVGQQVLIDAQTGEFVAGFALIHEALNRRISDAANTSADPGTLVRTEGQGASAIADANLAYDYLGDTYNFYSIHFGRDGIANDGAPMVGVVRYCQPTKPCPLKNAFWNGVKMYFGASYAVDDIVAHELTHGVTANESGLIYKNESGAINESLSDVFGEFVDLTNGKGTDGSLDRWLIGEDLPFNYDTFRSSIRSMSSPSIHPFNHPDWLGSSYYQQPSNTNDNGGVHSNSGVNNKLCYLLTDGDTFRDIPVTGMGIDRVAALYYEANVNLLGPSSGWNHLAISLRQAAINLGWSSSDRANLDRGLLAVGIGSPLPQYFVDEGASSACFHTGDSYCSFLFDDGPYNNLNTAISEHSGTKTLLLRGTAHATRLTGSATIRSWDGPARIQP